MSESGRESLPDVHEWSGVPPGCPGVVGRPSWKSGKSHEDLSEVRSGRQSLPEVRSGRQSLPEVREWSGGPPKYPEVVGRPFWKFRRPSLKSGRGREALPEVRKSREDLS